MRRRAGLSAVARALAGAAGVILLLACRPVTAGTQNAAAAGPLPRDGAQYWPAAEWRRGDPARLGLDAARLSSLAQRLTSGGMPGLNALVVVRHGYVAVEAYANGSSAAHVHTMQSVTKSVTSLVTGIAVDEGLITESSRILDVLPEYDSLTRGDDRKRQVTIGHLLAMRSGIDFHESPYGGSPLQRLNESTGDWTAIALGEPMNAAPGTRWQYNSGGVIAVAAAVRRASGMPFDAYARQKLFAPIGVTDERWIRSPYDGLSHTGGGLYLRAMDLARVGYLVLRRGVWNAQRIVSERWLTESLRPRTIRPRSFGPYATDYGYLWWLMPLDGGDTDPGDVMYVASGNLNQWLFVVPRHDLVVAITGQSNQALVLDVVYRDILPSIRD
ncbi:MAG TPA: serine hydrolase [Gemmatimonadaceae bacterium]|nr:serine hydrolase [Gemmatimonadaceae bacterium]